MDAVELLRDGGAAHNVYRGVVCWSANWPERIDKGQANRISEMAVRRSVRAAAPRRVIGQDDPATMRGP